MGKNTDFLKLAEQLTPPLIKKNVYPETLIRVIKDETAFQGWRVHPSEPVESLAVKSFGPGESFILDFSDHQVGYLNFSVKPVGSPADAPLRLKFIFGEMPCEAAEDFDSYEGWLSRSWLQDEIINIDVLPNKIELPRRNSFRYLKIVIMNTSKKYKVSFSDIFCKTVTSGDTSSITPLPESITGEMKTMDEIGIKTLRDCMQLVFEDGPKRDRRLWIGDLRLQANANYFTFKNNSLVKRCLYLFAGLTLDDGHVGACLYTEPEPLADDIYLYDYSLFFVATLHDYYLATSDKETLDALWSTALRQIELAIERLDVHGIVKDDASWWCFIDWHQALNKQASAQAVLIYCLKRGLELAKILGAEDSVRMISKTIEFTSQAAMKHLWDEGKGFFRSGSEGQVSWASQIWMVLAEVFDHEKSTKLLDRLFSESPDIRPTTPYMYHHLVEALFQCGQREKAISQMKSYWGEMVKDGADCFWELYNPEDKFFSPYGSNLINSYCHAWSCTPAYFIRKYLV